MHWTDTPEGHRCLRHGLEFDRGDVCHRCVDDPGDAITGIADEDVAELRTRISEYRANSRTCLRECNRLRRDGTARDGALAVKWNDAAIKWARLAEERQEVLDSRDHDMRLIRHEQEMSGVRSGH